MIFKKFRARVVRGAGRGKGLGFSTINLDPSRVSGLIPGIYLARIEKPYFSWGLVHFGPRPTFGEKDFSFELFLLNFKKNKNIPKVMTVYVKDLLRGVKNFKTEKGMIAQIEKDVENAKKIITKRKI